MSGTWRVERIEDADWRAPARISRAQRAQEQDDAAGSRQARLLPMVAGRQAAASVALRMPQPGRRVYGYLRWNAGGRTNERYIGEVVGQNRSDLLRDGWRQVTERGLLPRTSLEALSANSWASTPEVRNVMRANPRRDTKPERELRSQLHGRGLRYRVDYPPVPGLRRRADIVFPRAKVAIFVDGCFWHGCPDHYRAASKNADYWNSKRTENAARDQRTDDALSQAGWQCVRIWEHEDMVVVANRIAALLRASAEASTAP